MPLWNISVEEDSTDTCRKGRTGCQSQSPAGEKCKHQCNQQGAESIDALCLMLFILSRHQHCHYPLYCQKGIRMPRHCKWITWLPAFVDYNTEWWSLMSNRGSNELVLTLTLWSCSFPVSSCVDQSHHQFETWIIRHGLWAHLGMMVAVGQDSPDVCSRRGRCANGQILAGEWYRHWSRR